MNYHMKPKTDSLNNTTKKYIENKPQIQWTCPKIALFQQKFLHHLLSTNWLKYLRTNEPLTSWTVFPSLFGRFTVHTQHTQQFGQKVRKKVFNWSDVHLYHSNFLQNPYFRSWRLKTNWKQKRADNKKEQRWMDRARLGHWRQSVDNHDFFFFFFFSHCCQYPRGFGQTNENRAINDDKGESYRFVNLIQINSIIIYLVQYY